MSLALGCDFIMPMLTCRPYIYIYIYIYIYMYQPMYLTFEVVPLKGPLCPARAIS